MREKSIMGVGRFKEKATARKVRRWELHTFDEEGDPSTLIPLLSYF
jgi:hypothetical protein